MSGEARPGEDEKVTALARTISGQRRDSLPMQATDPTIGPVRRLDSGASPDRRRATVHWPDGRRPRPRHVEGAAAAVAEGLRLRLHGEPELDVEPDFGREPVPGESERTSAAARDDPDRLNELDSVAEPRLRVARRGRRRDGVEANARLTGSTAAVLFVLLFVEGVTILRIGPLLNVHVFVGMLLIPPVLVKVGSTTWRLAKYYLGDPAYRKKGPPAPLLRVLGPVVVVLTVVVLASGVALLLASPGWRTRLLLLHKVSFVLWFVAMAVHVLCHLLDTAKLAPRDWYWRTRRQIAGASVRQWLVASAVVLGLIVGVLMLPHVGTWLSGGHHTASGANHH